MTPDRHKLRQTFLSAWQKHEDSQPLETLEQQLVNIILQHPEYQKALKKIDQDYRTDNNPFLHMSLHLGIIEQVSTNRPKGIRKFYQELVKKIGDAHAAEHKMMDCLAEFMWQAQQTGVAPDENQYLKKLKKVT